MQSGLYLYAPGTGGGTYVELNAKNGASSEQWEFQPATGGYYTIQGVQSGDLLDDYQNGTTNGTRVDIWPANSGNNQQWLLTPR